MIRFNLTSVLLCLLFFSCRSTRENVTLRDLPASGKVELPELQITPAVIQPDDQIEIRVTSAINQEAANRIMGLIGVTQLVAPVFLVDSDGYIDLPQVGRIKIGGLTREQARQKLTTEIIKYVREPIVNVRLINFRFTVLGEVKTPGNFSVNNERVSILDALGYAGDFTEFAKRSSVRIIRDSSGKREIGMVDFTKQSSLTSPYYYLRRNDVVFIEAMQNKATFQSLSRTGIIIGAASSVLALVLTIVNISK